MDDLEALDEAMVEGWGLATKDQLDQLQTPVKKLTWPDESGRFFVFDVRERKFFY